MSTMTQSENLSASQASRLADPNRGARRAWVTKGPRQPFVLESFEMGPLGTEDVEVAVESSGQCHSDLSALM